MKERRHMQLLGIHETTLYANDLVAAARFYHEVLGLVMLSEEVGQLACGFRLPSGSVLLLFDATKSGRPGRDVPSHGAIGPGHLAFAITHETYDQWLARLQAHGVEIEQQIDWPGEAGKAARSIYFRDPAGNSVELMAGDYWAHVEAGGG